MSHHICISMAKKPLFILNCLILLLTSCSSQYNNTIGVFRFEDEDTKIFWQTRDNDYVDNGDGTFSIVCYGRPYNITNFDYYDGFINEGCFSNRIEIGFETEKTSNNKIVQASYSIYDSDFLPFKNEDGVESKNKKEYYSDNEKWMGEEYSVDECIWIGDTISITTGKFEYENPSYLVLNINANWNYSNKGKVVSRFSMCSVVYKL